jgi:HPt (histidine-containing phosphotransfer) domain-containing protein
MNDYVSKPISATALAEALDRWLPKETAATMDPAPVASPEVGRGSAPAPKPPVFDQTGLMERILDDEEFAHVLVAGYLEDLPRQLQALRETLKAGDVAGAARRAHTIKGSAANVGGEALRAVALQLEEALESGETDAVSIRLLDVEQESVRLRDAMGQFLDCG